MNKSKNKDYFKKNIIISNLITIFTLINKIKFTHILINTKYFIYKIINFIFIRKVGFKRINIPTRKLIEIRRREGHINKVVKVEIDIDRHK